VLVVLESKEADRQGKRALLKKQLLGQEMNEKSQTKARGIGLSSVPDRGNNACKSKEVREHGSFRDLKEVNSGCWNGEKSSRVEDGDVDGGGGGVEDQKHVFFD
jgi:hypothetical protein